MSKLHFHSNKKKWIKGPQNQWHSQEAPAHLPHEGKEDTNPLSQGVGNAQVPTGNAGPISKRPRTMCWGIAAKALILKVSLKYALCRTQSRRKNHQSNSDKIPLSQTEVSFQLFSTPPQNQARANISISAVPKCNYVSLIAFYCANSTIFRKTPRLRSWLRSWQKRQQDRNVILHVGSGLWSCLPQCVTHANKFLVPGKRDPIFTSREKVEIER